jgi:ribonuclease Z
VKGVDILYHEATYVSEYEDKAAARYHSTTFQAATVALEAGVGTLIVGHYSSRCKDLSLFETECRSIFPESHAASDGEIFDVPMKDKVERAGR